MTRPARFARTRPRAAPTLPRVAGMQAPNPLRDGNRLQRAYHRWALPYYERMAPELREQVEALDIYLYTRKGLPAWLGWLLGLVAAAWALRAAGLGWVAAPVVGLLVWGVLSLAILSAWLTPDAFLSRKPVRLLLNWVSFGLMSGLVGVAVGHWVRHGRFDLPLLAQRVLDGLHLALPVVLAASIGPALLFWAIASVSRQATLRRLERAQLGAERDAAARAAAEADLRLLQAQVQPHFVFNTLATLQHWVDRGDARAGPLLRELTGFLRAGTEMLGQPRVALAEEWQAVSHYLAILGARLGGRLRTELELDPSAAALPVPPGLLLTLVENAIEHGIEPRIGGGSLRVQVCRDGDAWSLRVQDDGVGLAADAAERVGLHNLRQRLRHHFGATACLRLDAPPEGGCRAEIRLPAADALPTP